ncbi:MAG: transketolase [Anaerosomatales bacterium]|nr:transketolase [Anaerosomatales bacterium]
MDQHEAVSVVRQVAARMRLDIVEMIAEAGSGHPGGSLSAADIVAALYFGGVLHHDPGRPDMPERDRFVLSKGHAAPVLYAALAEAGYFGRDHLATLRKLGSILQGHPDSKKTSGVEVSTGSLGQGLSISVGLALGLALDESASRVFCLLGDGELQEGQVWEAAMAASHHGAGNLVAIVDHNGLQIDGACSEVMCLGDVEAKFRAFGWRVLGSDGHDVPALLETLAAARESDGGVPTVVVCRTVKGRGVSFMEGEAGWHGKAPNAAETEQAVAELRAAIEREGVPA